MHQRDYILRLIEELGAILVAIRRRIMGQEMTAEAADEELSAVANKVGMDLTILRSLAGESLHLFAAPGGEVDPSRAWLMGEILYLDGLQAKIEERFEDAEASLGKARYLFTLIAPGGGMLVGFEEAEERIADIDETLAEIG